MRRAQAPLHMQSWHAWFTEGAQSCGIYRCVAPLYRPPSHASSLKAGKSQSLVTQLKRSLGDRLCKESFQFSNFTASSEALVHLDFILTNAWNTDCVQPPLWTCSRMDWLWPRLYLLKTKWTHSCLEQAASAGDSSPCSPAAPKCQFSRASSWWMESDRGNQRAG